jgi:hypothetical protein
MARRFVPSIVFAAFVVYLASPVLAAWWQTGAGFDLGSFRRLPVSVNGRVQPFDSAARMALMRIRGTVDVPLDAAAAREAKTGRLGPTEWLLEVLAKPDLADRRPIFPVTAPGLLKTLALPPAAGGTRFFAFRELAPKVEEMSKQTERIAKMKDAERAGWERDLLLLRAQLVAYERLKNSVQPNSVLQRDAKGSPVTFDFTGELATFRHDLTDAFRIAELHRLGRPDRLDAATEQRIRAFAARFEGVSRIGLVATVPPRNLREPRERWLTTGAAIVAGSRGTPLTLSVGYVATLVSAYAHEQPEVFNDALAKYRHWLNVNGVSEAVDQASLETLYNVLQPFVRALAIDLVALLALAFWWVNGSAVAYRAGKALVVLGLSMHTLGIAFAYRLAGRPSVLSFAVWATALAVLVLGVRRRGAGFAASAGVAVLGVAASFALAPGGAARLARGLADAGLASAVLVAAVAIALGTMRGAEASGQGAAARQDGLPRVRRHPLAVH